MNDCVIVGGGPAGFAASVALTERGVDHLILEQGRVGQTWRRQRWDSFRLNTPGWMNGMLGEQPRDAYLTAPEMVTRLEWLAAKAPVREQTAVSELCPEDVGAQVDLRPPPDQPALVDLRAHDVSTVVWCTGFTGDFSWLPPDLLGPGGNPRREDAAAPVPGLWYLGLRWLTRRSSGIMQGMPGDAATVAGAVQAHLSARN